MQRQRIAVTISSTVLATAAIALSGGDLPTASAQPAPPAPSASPTTPAPPPTTPPAAPPFGLTPPPPAPPPAPYPPAPAPAPGGRRGWGPPPLPYQTPPPGHGWGPAPLPPPPKVEPLPGVTKAGLLFAQRGRVAIDAAAYLDNDARDGTMAPIW